MKSNAQSSYGRTSCLPVEQGPAHIPPGAALQSTNRFATGTEVVMDVKGSAPATPPAIRIGTQGWNYTDWVGALYPLGTKPRAFLELYARAFDTAEVNSTFYAIPAAKTVRGWADRTPGDFLFSLKLPREITHERRLVDARPLLDEFVDAALELGPKLGPILVQLGPDFGPGELPALEAFLPLLPVDLRFAIEFRQPGWICDPVIELLRSYGVALAASDGRWMSRDTVTQLASSPTADFLYVRWMGQNRDITEYSRALFDRSEVIGEWADTLCPLPAEGISVLAYFNNHFSGHSPASARELQRRLGQQPTQPAALRQQMVLPLA